MDKANKTRATSGRGTPTLSPASASFSYQLFTAKEPAAGFDRFEKDISQLCSLKN